MYLTIANQVNTLEYIKKELYLSKFIPPNLIDEYIDVINILIENNNDRMHYYTSDSFIITISDIKKNLDEDPLDNDYLKNLKNSFDKLSQYKTVCLVKSKNTPLELPTNNLFNNITQVLIFISLIVTCSIILFNINKDKFEEPISIITFITFFIALNIYFIYAIYTYKKESSHKKTLQTLLHIYNNNQLDSKQRERFLNFFLSEFSTSKEKAPFDLDFLKFQKSKN